VVATAHLLRDRSDICFAIVGDGSDKARLVEMVAAKNLREQVHFVEQQPLAKMPELFAAADALLVHLRDSSFSQLAIPTKTLAYLASGKPILMAMRGAAAELVAEAAAGRVVPPEDPHALERAIRELVDGHAEDRETMGKCGKEFLARNLSKEVVVPRYRAILTRFALATP